MARKQLPHPLKSIYAHSSYYKFAPKNLYVLALEKGKKFRQFIQHADRRTKISYITTAIQ